MEIGQKCRIRRRSAPLAAYQGQMVEQHGPELVLVVVLVLELMFVLELKLELELVLVGLQHHRP